MKMTITQIKDHPKIVVTRIDSEEIYGKLSNYFNLPDLFESEYKYRILSVTNQGKAKSIDNYLGSDYFVIDETDIIFQEDSNYENLNILRGIHRIFSTIGTDQEDKLFQIKRLISEYDNI